MRGDEPGRVRASHLAAVILLSAAWEALFLRHGISLVDEGWALYTVLQLEHGRALYRDILWVFPPGHLLAAWIGRALDPPGLLVARGIYSAFTVALCGALYVLGCRMMPARFALLAALVVAVAAPRSHATHVLFGFRYLVFGVLALLALDAWLRSGRPRWLVAAGLATGVCAVFRLSPAFAVACGLGVGVLAAPHPLRERLRGLGALALGVALPTGLALAVLAPRAGLPALWRELVVRPAVMVEQQALPFPPLALAVWSREAIREAFVAFEFRAIWVLCALMLLGLGAAWLRAASARRPFGHALPLASAVFASVFFLRSVHRSDEHHLDSALPPVVLLFALAAWWALRGLAERLRLPARRRALLERTAVAALFAAWVFLTGADLWLAPARRGLHPLESTGGAVRLAEPELAATFDELVAGMRTLPPDARVLDLTVSPMLHVLSGRLGPGRFDVVMPGTFLDREEERRFVAWLARHPPRGVILPSQLALEPRFVPSAAPLLWRWVRAHFREGRRALPAGP